MTASWCSKAELESELAVSRKVRVGTGSGMEAEPAARFRKAAAF